MPIPAEILVARLSPLHGCNAYIEMLKTEIVVDRSKLNLEGEKVLLAKSSSNGFKVRAAMYFKTMDLSRKVFKYKILIDIFFTFLT